MSKNDVAILRELAKQLAEIAADPIHRETRQAWHALHRLKPVRSMFMVDELPWNEMNVNDELTLRCADPYHRYLETTLRRRIYHWRHIRDDFVYEPVIHIPKKIDGFDYSQDEYCFTPDFGIKIAEQTLEHETGNNVLAHAYFDQLKTEEDLEKLKVPRLGLNKEVTSFREQTAKEIFDGILEVKMDGFLPIYNLWDMIPEWRGFDEMLFDMIDNPEFIHKTVVRARSCFFDILDQLEEQGLLNGPDAQVHCCGAWTDLLPAAGYDPSHPRAKDMWTFGMAQIFSTMSPEMHNEFEVEYAKDWYARFGLGYYGCCEPLDDRMEYVKKIPNIRKISVSAWVRDYDRMAESLEGKYVYSSKPSPALVLDSSWDPAYVESDLRRLKASADRYNCPSEFTLKDISTVNHRPDHIWQWAEIMRRIVKE